MASIEIFKKGLKWERIKGVLRDKPSKRFEMKQIYLRSEGGKDAVIIGKKNQGR